jgi:protein-disulfide isomerase
LQKKEIKKMTGKSFSFFVPDLKEMKRYLPFAIIAGVLALTLGTGGLFYHLKQQALTRAKAKTEVANSLPPKPGATPPHIQGDANARVTLEEFGDFQCPPCARVAPAIKQVEKDYGSQLRVVFRQCPMAMHQRALDAACASEAAGLQGHFWEMHQALYDNQWIWSRVPYARLFFADRAKDIGLDVERFKKDMDSDQVKTRIAADQERGASLGVDRTPVIFVHKRRLPETELNEAGLRKAIDAALNEKSK